MRTLRIRSLQLSAIYLCLILAGNANSNENTIEADANFLAFLADVEEATGDGFDQWLESGSILIDCNQNESNLPLGEEKNCQEQQ